LAALENICVPAKWSNEIRNASAADAAAAAAVASLRG